MEEFKIRITGTRPVLFHNAAELVNPFSDVNKKKNLARLGVTLPDSA